MISPKSPFSSVDKRKSVDVQIPSLSNTVESLAKRKVLREKIDLNSVSLLFVCKTSSKLKPTYQRDFTALACKFPHHEDLLRQLLFGHTKSAVGIRFASYQTYQMVSIGIKEFIEFLNSDEPLPSPIFCVADCSYLSGSLFKSWLVRTSPGRTINRKIYAAVRNILSTLQLKFSEEKAIGPRISWPPGPGHVEVPTESYTLAAFNQLVDGAMKDMRTVMERMEAFPGMVANADTFNDVDRVRHWKRAYDGSNTREEDPLGMLPVERMAFATANRRYPSWPLGFSIEEAQLVYVYTGNDRDSIANERARNVIQKFRFGDQDAPIARGQMAYIAHFAFVGSTLYPFLLFIQMNTGWNLESILALSDCLDDHIEEDLLDEHYCVIYSTKQRTSKAVAHRSNKNSSFSVYRVLRFVERHVVKHKESPHYISGSLWQYVATKNMWSMQNGLVFQFTFESVFHTSGSFLSRHAIDLGALTKFPVVESRRIRTTYVTRRREQGLSTDEISPLMGHKDIYTTDKHYDNDTGSLEFKNRKIRELQNQHLIDFRNYSARLVESGSLQELKESIDEFGRRRNIERLEQQIGNVSEKEIVHLLSPSGQTYIAACVDSFNPTWEGASKFLSPGDQCRYFNRCCLCSQALIFREALPWIARRIIDLEAQKDRIPFVEWELNYGEEKKGWSYIMENWSDKDAVEAAEKMALKDEYTLPILMVKES